jgi:RNA polymerase sigma-70 factor (ECF subfamily)
MALPDPAAGPASHGNGRFATTRWTLIAAAQDEASPQARDAVSSLCEAYWYPLYAYIRRRGFSAEQAQDLTQEFFANLLERHTLALVDPARGRFRSFLLAACDHFLAHERDRAQAQKRGGGRTIVSLDFSSAEGRYHGEPSDPDTPERLFARRWATTLLEQVFARLRQDYAQKGKGDLFDRLRVFLLGEKSAGPYIRVAEALGMTEGAVKVAAHRLRQRFREVLREEIGRTVEDPTQVDDEIRELFAALAS